MKRVSLILVFAFLLALPFVFISPAPASVTASPIITLDDCGANNLVPASAGYVGNSNTMKFHYTSCTWANKIAPSHRVPFSSREEAISAGYMPCKVCKP